MSRKEFYIRRSRRNLTGAQRYVAYMNALLKAHAAKEAMELAREKAMESLRRFRKLIAEVPKRP